MTSSASYRPNEILPSSRRVREAAIEDFFGYQVPEVTFTNRDGTLSFLCYMNTAGHILVFMEDRGNVVTFEPLALFKSNKIFEQWKEIQKTLYNVFNPAVVEKENARERHPSGSRNYDGPVLP